ncbi:MAG: glycosyltransferase family 4 protein [Betaproteobacteria bacterium]|nr:glycosyltransferase family 4 protein [Betaproteobacteria bacterium]
MLSADALEVPSARLPVGVVTYAAADPEIALAACRESERQAVTGRSPAKVACYPPGTARALSIPRNQLVDSTQIGISLLVLIIAALSSGIACYLIVRYDNLHAHLSHDHMGTGPQKFHAVPTPRVGGLSLLIGMLVTAAVLPTTQPRFAVEEFSYLLLASLPAFAGGIAEDLTKKVGVMPRLLLTMLAAAIAAWLLGAALERLDVSGIDALLRWSPVGIVFTVFAVSGVANAINIIDGYNGLAGGYAVIALTAIAWVAAQVGDIFLVTSALTMIGALLGFLFWNYPKGRIFLGDGGAYLIGFWLAELSVLLVVRHPEVSPWFPLLLMVYPIFETLFSIYRRTFRGGRLPGQPDAHHLHQLIYKRVLRAFVGTRNPALMTRRNSMVAVQIWGLSIFCAVPAIVFWRQTSWLMIFTLAFCVFYLWIYRRITRWRTPAWLIRHKHSQNR